MILVNKVYAVTSFIWIIKFAEQSQEQSKIQSFTKAEVIMRLFYQVTLFVNTTPWQMDEWRETLWSGDVFCFLTPNDKWFCFWKDGFFCHLSNIFIGTLTTTFPLTYVSKPTQGWTLWWSQYKRSGRLFHIGTLSIRMTLVWFVMCQHDQFGICVYGSHETSTQFVFASGIQLL